MNFSSLSITTILWLCSVSQDMDWVPFDRTKFDNCEFLDEDSNVALCFQVEETKSRFGMAAKSEGYLALGISDTGSMKAADIALFYTRDGENVLEHRRSEEFATPELVDSQALTLLEGSQGNGVTSFVYERENIAQCFSQSNDIQAGGWQYFIYAYSDSNSFEKHKDGKVGLKQVNLNPSEEDDEQVDLTTSDIKTWEIRVPELEVSTNTTTYCYFFSEIPVDKPYHIIAEEPVIQSRYLDHGGIYNCQVDQLDPEMLERYTKEPFCRPEGNIEGCDSFFSLITPGLPQRVLPANIGKPFPYKEGQKSILMLEIHYNNPDGDSGQKDDSGLKYYYTDKLRPIEMGILTWPSFH